MDEFAGLGVWVAFETNTRYHIAVGTGSCLDEHDCRKQGRPNALSYAMSGRRWRRAPGGYGPIPGSTRLHKCKNPTTLGQKWYSLRRYRPVWCGKLDYEKEISCPQFSDWSIFMVGFFSWWKSLSVRVHYC